MRVVVSWVWLRLLHLLRVRRISSCWGFFCVVIGPADEFIDYSSFGVILVTKRLSFRRTKEPLKAKRTWILAPEQA